MGAPDPRQCRERSRGRRRPPAQLLGPWRPRPQQAGPQLGRVHRPDRQPAAAAAIAVVCQPAQPPLAGVLVVLLVFLLLHRRRPPRRGPAAPRRARAGRHCEEPGPEPGPAERRRLLRRAWAAAARAGQEAPGRDVRMPVRPELFQGVAARALSPGRVPGGQPR